MSLVFFIDSLLKSFSKNYAAKALPEAEFKTSSNRLFNLDPSRVYLQNSFLHRLTSSWNSFKAVEDNVINLVSSRIA